MGRQPRTFEDARRQALVILAEARAELITQWAGAAPNVAQADFTADALRYISRAKFALERAQRAW